MLFSNQTENQRQSIRDIVNNQIGKCYRHFHQPLQRQHRYSYHHHHRIRSGTPLSSMVIVVAVFFITILLQHSQVASGELYSDNSSVYNVIANEDISGSYFSPSTSRLRRSPIFQNEFAVYIPSGTDVADSLADKYGFSNLGQVSFFNFFLFHCINSTFILIISNYDDLDVLSNLNLL